MKHLLPTLGTAAVLVFPPNPASAQRLEAGPTLGLYLPTKVTVQQEGLEVKQRVGISLGLRLGLRFGDHFGLHSGVNYIPSNVMVTNLANGLKQSVGARIITGLVGADLWIFPKRKTFAWVLRAGLGLTNRGGKFYEGATGTTDIGGVVGAAARIRFGRLLSFQAGVDDYLYRANFESGGITNQHRQHDLQFSFGVGIPILGVGM